MTAQAAETLIYKGEELAMCETPLDVFMQSNGRGIRFQERSTACWRGYIGTWQIWEDRLYLVDVSATLEDGSAATLEGLFPGYPDGVFAHWFTGEVRCPMGKQLQYVHRGFSSVFEKDLFLEFKAGVLVSERIVDNGVSHHSNAPTKYHPAAWLSYPPKVKDPEKDDQ
jgi:hypothetical protein